MKGIVLFITTAVISANFLFAEIRQPVDLPEEIILKEVNSEVREPVQRSIPEYNFNVEPKVLMASWYDYFPGSFVSIPIRVQSSPAGDHEGGGIYLAFQATPAAGGTRSVYSVYIKEGEIYPFGSFGVPDSEGFPGIDIDPDTGNPILSWHSFSSADPDYFQCPLTIDQYSLLGDPGLWTTPYNVIDNPYTIDGVPGQQFIWPQVFIGPSPNPGQKRIYVIGQNVTPNLSDLNCGNYLIAFADFTDHSDLILYDPDMWTYITIPQMNAWRDMDIRPFGAPVVSRHTGRIAFAGHTKQLDTDEPYPDTSVLFVLENDNYGEGDWTLYTGDPTIPVDNPDVDLFPYQDMRYKPYVNRSNVALDDQGNYHFAALYTLSTEENTWYPSFTTSKHVKFDRSSEEFIITDLYPRNEDGTPYLPWKYTPWWDLVYNYSFPCYWYDHGDIFKENYHRIIQDGPRMVALFQESTKAYQFHIYEDDDYADWAAVPETHIMISADYGETWEDPIILNSLETPELAGMIPAYWYLSDHIEHLYDEWYRIHLFFYSQNDYGSFIVGNGPDTGGDLVYTSLDINFPATDTDDEVLAVDYANTLKKNYPNPFNPETTIEFSLARSEKVQLAVYNIKGQRVKTLYDGYRSAGDHQVVWNGRDERGRELPSGVYLYRLVTDKEEITRKMMILK
jgi:hypothetical protein